MKTLFPKLPYFLKLIFINIYAYIQQKNKLSKGFYRALEYYNKIDFEKKYKFSKEKFQNQIKNHPFFSDTEIQNYPIIDKKQIKEKYENIINKDFIKSYLYTSGTTGSGLKFPISQEFQDHQLAVFWKFRNIHNLKLDSWCAYIIGQTIFDIDNKKPPFWITSYPSNQLLFSQYHLNKDSVKLYLQKLIDSKIKWLHAYPSVLNNFANLIKEQHLENMSKQLSIQVITTSSEKLFTYQKENIETIFNCKVRELYGLTEGVVNIFECEHGTLHIDESYSYVELIPTKNRDEYRIIGTSYHNKAFPLIRYDTGDTCILHEKDFSCSCNRKSRVVKEILGRNEDYLILDDNTKIGRLDHIFKDMIEVQEAQIYQSQKGSATFKIVKSKSYTQNSEEKLKKRIKDKLGNSFNFQIEYFKEIPKTKRGKLKFVVSVV